MNKKISTWTTCICLLLCPFTNIQTQSIIGAFSDTVYLLSVFHNSGEEKNIDENYYCAVFLDKESDVEGLLPLKTEEYMHVHYDTSDINIGKYTFIKPNDTLERRITGEIDNHFIANACIGAGVSFVRACWEYLKSHDTAAYYYFIKDTLLHSEISSYPLYSDVLLGEIVEPLATGGMIICSDPPCEPLELNYKERGTYYRLFKLCIEYLLFDDEVGNILAQSYSYTINTSPYVPENIQNLKILIGDISGNGAFVCPLKVVRMDGKLLTALPYSVANLTGE